MGEREIDRRIEEEEEEQESVAVNRAMAAGASTYTEPDSWYNKLHDEDDVPVASSTLSWQEFREMGESVVKDYIARSGLTVNARFRLRILKLIQRAYLKMKLNNDVDKPQKLDEARQNLSNFMEIIINEAETNNLIELDTSIISNSSTRYCPVYPFDEFV